MAVYSRIKELRESKNESQATLARSLGISQSALGNYERGDRVPDADLILKLARFFGVSSDYILGLSDTTTPQIEAVHDLIGLSEESTKVLSNLLKSGATEELRALNAIISSGNLKEFLLSFAKNMSQTEIESYASVFKDFGLPGQDSDADVPDVEALNYALAVMEKQLGDTVVKMARESRERPVD